MIGHRGQDVRRIRVLQHSSCSRTSDQAYAALV